MSANEPANAGAAGARQPFAPVDRSAWSVLLLVLVLVVLQWSGLVLQADRLIQDHLLALGKRSVDQSQVVIVGLDDKSISRLGRWPWSRALHAELIDQISAARPRAIGLDLLLTEAAQPEDDRLLAASIAASGKVVMPVLMQNANGLATMMPPVEPLRKASNRLGHVHLDIDDDGIERGVYLREGPDTGELTLHFAAAMAAVADPSFDAKTLPGVSGAGRVYVDDVTGQSLVWHRANRIVIPFAGPAHHFPRLSYVDVLEGRVPPEVLRDKYVLVGATAVGLGDNYATPMSRSGQLMPGVEVIANILDGLLGGHELQRAPGWLDLLINLAVVLLVFAGFSKVNPAMALGLTAVGVLSLLSISLAAMAWLQLQLAPTAGILGVLLAYGVWSWRRLAAATRFLVGEVERVQGSAGMRAVSSARLPDKSGDFMSRRILALRQAGQQLSDLYSFVRGSIEALPDAMLVCNREGEVLLANVQADRLFAGAGEIQGSDVLELTRGIVAVSSATPALSRALLAGPPRSHSVMARDKLQRDLLVKLAPSVDGQDVHTGWLISLVDISELRKAQRQRDDAIRFLGHDIRAPQSSIIALLEMRRHNPESVSQDQFEARIERHAMRTLSLSDDFIHLLRAQSYDYQFRLFNLADLLQEAMDEVWESARQRQVSVTLAATSEPEAWAMVDRELVMRMLGNLLGNAIKFVPEGGAVRCEITEEWGQWNVAVADNGPGVPLAAQAGLFEAFARGSASAKTAGAGLGLAFVKTVATRHQGSVNLVSVPGEGARFCVLLPKAPAPA